MRRVVTGFLAAAIGFCGLWFGVTAALAAAETKPVSGDYVARVTALEKDPAYSRFHRKLWWVVHVRMADGSERTFRQEAPWELKRRWSPGEEVRLRYRVSPVGSAFRIAHLEIDDPVVRNWPAFAGFMVGAVTLLYAVLTALKKPKQITAPSAPRP